jgi:hypothetical protein
MKQIAIYTTQAEAFVDFIHFYNLINEKVGTGVVAKLTPRTWVDTTVEFPISERNFSTITPNIVLEVMREVPDGHVMCRNLELELYECDDETSPDGPCYTVDWVRENTRLISKKTIS